MPRHAGNRRKDTVGCTSSADRSTDANGRVVARVARIVSTSGIPHHDVGNYTKSRFWKKGKPKGIPDSQTWRSSIDYVLSTLAAEGAGDYLHTGDMVSGRWGLDKDRPKAGIFGPTDTLSQKTQAVYEAGDLYYRHNKSWWLRNGIDQGRVHFAMGDHEYGNTEPDGKPRPNQLAFIGKHREVWRKHFVDGRGYEYRLDEGQQRFAAYATVLDGGIGLITLDPIVKKDGLLLARIGGPQERWLEEILALFADRNDVHWIIVQVEIPPVGPNRAFHTGMQTLQNGDRIWELAEQYDVALVLAAEWHELTMRSNGGQTPVQIVHGSQMYQARVNYLVIDFFDDRSIEITARAMTGTRDTSRQMWAPHNLRAPLELTMLKPPTAAGALTIDSDMRVGNTSGLLIEYAGN